MRKLLIAALMFLAPTQALADELKLIGMEHFSIQGQQFSHNRDPYAMQYTGKWLYRVQANFRFSLLGAFYWDNNVHTEAVESGAVKTVGWHWELGLRLSENFTAFYEHHSRHIMEDRPEVPPGMHRGYPVEDSYGLRITVIEDTEKTKKTLSGWFFGGK